MMESSFDCPSALGDVGTGSDLDPYPNLAWLRSTMPVARVPSRHQSRDVWLVTSYVEARRCLADRRLAVVERPRDVRVGHPGIFTGTNPPEHTRVRRTVLGYFSPASVQGWRGRVREVCDQAVDRLVQRETADLVADYALPVPVAVIHEFLGVPEAVREPARRCMDLFFHAGLTDVAPPAMPGSADRATGPASGDAPRSVGLAVANTESYVDELIAYKHRHPGDDLITALLAARRKGEVRDDDELRAIVHEILGAGHLSTVPVLATAILELLQHPAALHAAVADSSRWALVAEETLRYDSAVQTAVHRVATEDLEIGGVAVRRGDTVAVSLAAANRDPERFTDPDVFRVDRPRRAHLAFGHGIHACFGAPLARLEVEVSLATLFHRLPAMRLLRSAGEIEWTLGPVLRGPRQVPVALDTPARAVCRSEDPVAIKRQQSASAAAHKASA